MKKVYLDYAATTPLDQRVLKAMMPYLKDKFGNASSIHLWGQEAKMALERSRKTVAKFLHCQIKEVIFTSCSTESINLAHKGLVEGVKDKGFNGLPHIITSQIEHKAVLETCKHLEKISLAKVTYLPVDKYGMIKPEDIKKAIIRNTILVSIIYINNEVGTVQAIQDVTKTINSQQLKAKNKIYFHIDATQAIQYLDCNVKNLKVDMLSLTGHKFYGPKGIGVLFVKRGTPLIRQQDGGGQEYKLRSGTENIAYIIGLAKAIELAEKNKQQVVLKVSKLRDRLIKGVLKIPRALLTGHSQKRAPHIASFIFPGAEGEAILLHLDSQGIAASSGSACTSGELKPSHVLTAMGFKPEIAHSSVRFSLGKKTTNKDIDYVIKVIPGIIKNLRRMNPLL